MSYEKEYIKLENLIKDKKIYKHKIKNQIRKTNMAFVEKNTKWIKTLNFLMCLCIFLNLLAVLITNILVVKENPTTEFLEANKAQSSVNDYKTHPDANKIMFSIMLNSILWAVILAIYFYYRLHMKTYMELFVITVYLTYLTYLITYDFINDFGFLIGKIFFGI